MPLHGLFERGLGGLFQVGKAGVKGIKFVEIAMSPYWWAWPTIGAALPVVSALQASLGERVCCHARRQACNIGRDVIQHPVYPGHSGCSRVGCVRVVDDKGEALGACGWRRPRERRRYVATIAGVKRRHLAMVLKGCRCECESHGFVSLVREPGSRGTDQGQRYGCLLPEFH